jgi:hypothetical protein
VNPPHNRPKDNLTIEERERRIKEANRQYFKAAGAMEDFYLAYPYERPPGSDPEERVRRVREANRAYFSAAGKMEDFYRAYPSERPPEREAEPKRERQRERGGGRGGR